MLSGRGLPALLMVTTAALLTGGGCEKKRPFLKYYESLSYNKSELLLSHQRWRREAEEDRVITLDLIAYNRNFSLMLERDRSTFVEDFMVVSDDKPVATDLSFIYKGRLADDEDSFCHGSIINGYFHGSIHTRNGTFYIEYEEDQNGVGDSYIYHESDIDYSLMKDVKSFDSALQQYRFMESMRWRQKDEHVLRGKRSLDLSRTTCLLHLKADYYFFSSFRNLQAAISQIAGYLMSVNAIFEHVNFDGIKHINFKVKVLHIMQEEQSDALMSSPYIGVEHLLSLHSSANWNHVCLSYLLTARDYSGVYGLAWVGRGGNTGGICSKYIKVGNGTEKVSKNTGLVTIKSHGQYLPVPLVHISLAHELAHSLGAPHDGDKECTQFTDTSPHGNYLMYPKAMDGSQLNNDKFSLCSIHYIGSILKQKKDDCFVESDQPICGNQIVEAGEQCDVGFNDNDTCCYSAHAKEGLQCTLRPGKQCSPSQGQCCTPQCSVKPQGERCRDEAECSYESHCTGASPKCPAPPPKDNHTLCNYGTKICLSGACSQSVCVKYGLEQCDCASLNKYEMCQLCCRKPGDESSCISTRSAGLSHLFGTSMILLPPGAPCEHRQGYCDKFHVCRLVDADGPIARLRKTFLKVIERDPAAWMKTRWWAVLLIILSVAAMMTGTVFVFGRNLDSDKEATKETSVQRPSSKRSKRRVISEESEDMAPAYWQPETRL
ncbi:disintegrin and metalloproteinase domain-containing protein 10-like [Hyperolius riggenbachi]|uniref:disintegrin and metalloproteinase domain-containing protein 10-like n=1 Tax=Hyperolius riggenbachi TaxID=752182 RepID=UPI0035A349F3